MKLAILYSGGTLGCVGNPLAPLAGRDFRQAFTTHIEPILKNSHKDSVFAFLDFYPEDDKRTLDSTDLIADDWCQLADRILQNYENHDGFIILHGTDSMEWSASALSFLLTGLDQQGEVDARLDKPVIFTGSQLPLFQQQPDKTLTLGYNTDALQNICGAINAAHAGINEVGLFFGDFLLRGNRSIKTDAEGFNAFSSPNYPELAHQGIEFSATAHIHSKNSDRVQSPSHPIIRKELIKRLEHIREQINNLKIIPFPAYPSCGSTLAMMLEACINQGVDGLILESYGSGNFPSGNSQTPTKGAIYQALKKARQQGAVIVDCTQVLKGSVNLEDYAAGSWLADKEIGAIGSKDMTPTASYCKLIYLQSLKSYHNWSQKTIEQLMQKNLSGEKLCQRQRGRAVPVRPQQGASSRSAAGENQPART